MARTYAFDKIMSGALSAGTYTVIDSNNASNYFNFTLQAYATIDVSKYIQALFTASDLYPSVGNYIYKNVSVAGNGFTVYWGKTTPYTADIEKLNSAGVEDTNDCASENGIALVWVDITGLWHTWNFLEGTDADEAETSEITVENYIQTSPMQRNLPSKRTITVSKKVCSVNQTKNQRLLLRTIGWSPLVFWLHNGDYIPVTVTSTSDVSRKALDDYEVEFEYSFDSQTM